LPYTLAKDKVGLGANIFTLGYPKEDIVYDKGYISSKNGFEGDDQQYTLELPAGHGQSGSPVIREDGYVIGILTAIGSQEEANTYAVSTKALMKLLHSLPDDKALHLPKTNKLAKMNREEQIDKMESYTFSVKVYKK
jgi:serine protease Do